MKLMLLLFLAFNATCFAKAPSVVAFPHKNQRAQSPDGRYLIFSEDHEGHELAHSLVLKDKRSGHSRKILDYGRHADVRWSPGLSAFYVNDYSGSDIENC